MSKKDKLGFFKDAGDAFNGIGNSLKSTGQVAMEQAQNQGIANKLSQSVAGMDPQSIAINRSTALDSQSAAAELIKNVNVDLNGGVGSLVGIDSFMAPDVINADVEERNNKMRNPFRYNERKNDPLVMEKLAKSDWFPGADKGINQGTFQSKTLGAVPIFAANGALVPFEVIAERDRAIKKAADARIEEREKIMVAAEIKAAAQFQPQLDDAKFDLIDEYRAKYNNNIEDIKKDPEAWYEYNRKLTELKNIGANTVRVDGMVNDVLTAMNDDNQYVPNSTRQAALAFSAGSGNIMEMHESGKLNGYAKELEKYSNMVSYVNTMKKEGVLTRSVEAIALESLNDPDFVDSLPESFGVAIRSRDSTIIARALYEHLPQDNIDAIAQGMSESGDFYENPEAIGNYIKNLMQSEIQVSDHVITKARQAYNNRGKDTESVFAAKRSSLIDESTGKIKPEVYSEIRSLSNAPSQKVMEYFGRVSNVSADLTNNSLQADLQLDFSAQPTQDIFASDHRNVHFQRSSKSDGKWYSFESFQKELENDYANKLEILKSDKYKKNKEGLEDFMKDNGVNQHQLSEMYMLEDMREGRNKFNGRYRPSSGSYEWQTKDKRGGYHILKTSEVSDENFDPNIITPTASITYTRMSLGVHESLSNASGKYYPQNIEVVDKYAPLMLIQTDLTTEGVQNLDAKFSKEGTQNKSDLRYQGGQVPNGIGSGQQEVYDQSKKDNAEPTLNYK
jgi:hypothetical protein